MLLNEETVAQTLLDANSAALKKTYKTFIEKVTRPDDLNEYNQIFGISCLGVPPHLIGLMVINYIPLDYFNNVMMVKYNKYLAEHTEQEVIEEFTQFCMDKEDDEEEDELMEEIYKELSVIRRKMKNKLQERITEQFSNLNCE